jgi:putative ribosome biogenesis GTPase RsgA
MSEEKQITMAEVSKHNTQEDCWLVIGNDKTGTSFLHLVNRNEAVSTNTINASNQLSGEQSSTTSRIKKRPLAVGDRVRIRNPKKDQPSIGVIDSYTPSKLFVRIKLENSNLIINRAPRNVAHINHDNN